MTKHRVRGRFVRQSHDILVGAGLHELGADKGGCDCFSDSSNRYTTASTGTGGSWFVEVGKAYVWVRLLIRLRLARIRHTEHLRDQAQIGWEMCSEFNFAISDMFW